MKIQEFKDALLEINDLATLCINLFTKNKGWIQRLEYEEDYIVVTFADYDKYSNGYTFIIQLSIFETLQNNSTRATKIVSDVLRKAEEEQIKLEAKNKAHLEAEEKATYLRLKAKYEPDK